MILDYNGQPIKYGDDYIEAVCIENIRITKNPDKMTYYIGETFDPTGMEVTAYYDDGTSSILNSYDIVYDSFVIPIKYDVTVTYAGLSDSIKVNVTYDYADWLIDYEFGTSRAIYFRNNSNGIKNVITVEKGHVIPAIRRDNIDATVNKFWVSHSTSSTTNDSTWVATNIVDPFLVSCNWMFGSMTKCTDFNLEILNTSNVSDMSWMFAYCRAMKDLDIRNFDTKKVADMQYMFYECEKLETVDLSNFNTSNVNNMQFMFYKCGSLKDLDLSHFDTSKVTTFASMFVNCNIDEIDIHNFNTSSATNIGSMFRGVKTDFLDLSHFDTSKVTAFTDIFAYSTIKVLDLSNWDTSNGRYFSMWSNAGQDTETIYVDNCSDETISKIKYEIEHPSGSIYPRAYALTTIGNRKALVKQ